MSQLVRLIDKHGGGHRRLPIYGMGKTPSGSMLFLRASMINTHPSLPNGPPSCVASLYSSEHACPVPITTHLHMSYKSSPGKTRIPALAVDLMYYASLFTSFTCSLLGFFWNAFALDVLYEIYMQTRLSIHPMRPSTSWYCGVSSSTQEADICVLTCVLNLTCSSFSDVALTVAMYCECD